MTTFRSIFLAAAGLIFLAFGVLMLITSYAQDHPGVFLALFFSSSLIILISLACLAGLAWRFFGPRPQDDQDSISTD